MDSRNREHLAYEDEISRYDYWKVIVKRKKLIIGLFIVSIVSATVISLLSPMYETYKGEVLLDLKMHTKEPKIVQLVDRGIRAKELIIIIGELNRERLKIILPKTHNSVKSIKLGTFENSEYILQISIIGKSDESVADAISEMVNYIKNFPSIKTDLEIEKEKLLEYLEELSNTIEVLKKEKRIYEALRKQGRIQAISYNPIYMQISDLMSEKILVENIIKNLNVKVVGQSYASKYSAHSNLKKNIVLAGLLSLLIGIFLSFFLEYLRKMNNRF